MSVFQNDCLKTIMGFSYMNHIKRNDIRSDLGIPTKINDIMKKKRLKRFDHIVKGVHAFPKSITQRQCQLCEPFIKKRTLPTEDSVDDQQIKYTYIILWTRSLWKVTKKGKKWLPLLTVEGLTKRQNEMADL